MITVANKAAIVAMKDAGVEIIELPTAEPAKLVEEGGKFLADWVSTADASGLPGQALLEEYTDLIAQFTQERDAKGYPWKRASN